MRSRLVFILFLFIFFSLLLSFNPDQVKASEHLVHNIDTGLGYITIQDAINDPQTQNGHTIFVEEGVYCEHVTVNKSLSLIGADQSNTVIDGNYSGNVVNITADNVEITGFTIQNSGHDSYHGVYSTSNNNSISHNTIVNNGDGIKIYKSSNNSVSGNFVVNNDYGVALSWYCDNNSISGNFVVNNDYGVALSWYCDNNSISGNNITSSEYGIFLHTCSDSFLQGNLLNGNQYGFGVEGFELNHYFASIDTSNLVDGNPIYYLINQQELTINKATHPQIGFLALINSTDISVENLNLTKNKQGVLLAYTNNTTIKNNTIVNNDDGIYLYNSSNNDISLNNITLNNHDGIKIYLSSNNSISENNITTNNYDGIFLSRSSNNTISLNSITFNNDDGIRLYRFCDHNCISRNNITNSKYGIGLPYCNNNSITENNIMENRFGVHVSVSSNHSITGNSITANIDYGIYLHKSYNNSIIGNEIADNGIGIRFQSSLDNVIYENNIVDNTESVYDDSWDPFEPHSPIPSINTWDDGHQRGNYWSDFRERYPNATELDNSGIWDTPYIIDNNNKDNYPIIPEFPSITILVLLLTITIAVVTIYNRIIVTSKRK